MGAIAERAEKFAQKFSTRKPETARVPSTEEKMALFAAKYKTLRANRRKRDASA